MPLWKWEPNIIPLYAAGSPQPLINVRCLSPAAFETLSVMSCLWCHRPTQRLIDTSHWAIVHDYELLMSESPWQVLAHFSNRPANGKTAVVNVSHPSSHYSFVILWHICRMPTLNSCLSAHRNDEKSKKYTIGRALLFAPPQLRGSMALRRNGESKHYTLYITVVIEYFLKISVGIWSLNDMHSIQCVLN